MKFLYTFCMLSLTLLYVGICPLFAKAPTKPKILFTSSRDGNREIYIMNPDGSEQVNITRHPSDDLDATWSPSGDQILFASDRDGVRDLYLMDPDGTNVQRIFKKETYRKDPTWSPNGKQFAYANVNWDAATSHICITTLGEQAEECIVVDGDNPVWSPDGTEIAYVAFILDATRIMLIDIRTHKQKRLLPRKAISSQDQPFWSTTGDKLVFCWNKNPLPPGHRPGRDRFPPEWIKKETIYIVNRDGTGLQQLVDEAGPKAVYPVLSPNEDELLYTQEINGLQQIFKFDMNNSVRTQLTHGGHFYQANVGGNWFDPTYALPVSPQPQLLTTLWGELKRE